MSWGLEADSGLARVMRESANWYLPDDHEFWNGYPDPSWATLFWHTFKRSARQVWRARPTSNSQPHPASQGEWGSTAGEAYCLFTSPREFDEFDESVSPEALQRIEFEDLLVVMVDMRWRRTIRKSLPGAGFMLDADLDELVRVLETETRTVCLVLAKPIIGFLPRRTLTKGPMDAGPEAFTEQYTRLWKALAARAAADRPTLTIAGDVHRHAVRGALDGRLLEVVSSPLSLLAALDDRSAISKGRRALAAARDAVRRVGKLLRRAIGTAEDKIRKVSTDVQFAYPNFGADGTWAPAAGSEIFLAGAHTSGIAAIEFDTTQPGRPAIIVRTIVEPADFSETLQTSTLHFEWRAGAGWQAIDRAALVSRR